MESEDIYIRIRQAREYAGLSQTALAKAIGVRRSAANQWESASLRKEPSTGNLVKIAVIAGVSFEWLATGRGEMVWGSKPGGIGEFASGYDRLTPQERQLLRLFGGLPERRQKALIEFLDTVD
jgi:transcriptional regulator with XRE-family HTH domain